MNTFKIFEGHDHFNNKPLYQVMGVNNHYSGEWHEDRGESKKELHELKEHTT